MGSAASQHRPDTAAAVVAMVGAGQLAQMTQQAAIALGVQLRVLAQLPDEPAVLAGADHRLGSPDDLQALLALADGADVVTFDHEQIDPGLLVELERAGVNLQPAPAAKLLAQDKLHARRELERMGFPVPPFTHAHSVEQVQAFAQQHGWPLVAKTPRGGYDGRGVFELADPEQAAAELATHPDGLLLEPLLEIRRELAAMVARSTTGEQVAYPVVESVQRDAMCREILAPAPIDAELAQQAAQMALQIAQRAGITGVVALELFDTPAGLLVNELALRPHNSGHYTIEGCVTSQFEQHLRGVLGWPLGATELTAPAVVMVNVVGAADGSDPLRRIPQALAVAGAHVHLYAKTARPGRKLGHVTVCGADLQGARATALRAARELGSEP